MSIDNTRQLAYKNNVEMELQLQTNPLEAAVMVTDDKSAKKVKIKDIVSNGSAVEDDERYGDTVWQSTEYDGVWLAKPKELYRAEIIEDADQLQTAIDLKGSSTMNGTGAINRARTTRILQGFIGNRITGEDGTTVNAFPAGNYIDVATGGAAATGMNTAKLIRAGEYLTEQYVPDEMERFMVLTAKDNSNLLKEVPATSSDFKGAFGGEFVNGKIMRMLGWNFIHLELDNPLLRVSSLYTDANGYRLNPFWAKAGVVLNYWQRIRTKVGEIPEKRFMPGTLVGTTCAASRTQEGLTGIIRNLKG